MKRYVAFVLLAAVLLSFTGCKKKQSESSSATNSSATSSQSAAVSSSTSVQEVENILEGTVTQLTETTITVTVNGEKLIFSVKDVKQMPEGLSAGAKVILTYTGEIEGKNTGKAKLIAIDVDKKFTGGTTPSSSSSQAEKKNTITGVIVDASMHAVVLNVDGKELMFSYGSGNANVQINAPSGLSAGSEVKITYTGKISGTDASNCTILRIDETKAAPTAQTPSDTMNYISGKVYSVSTTALSILTDSNGQQIDFVLPGTAAIQVAGGLREGVRVTIAYTGEIKDNYDGTGCKVSSVTEN